MELYWIALKRIELSWIKYKWLVGIVGWRFGRVPFSDLLSDKMAESYSRGCYMYKGGAAQILFIDKYWLRLTFGNCDQIVDFGELEAWVWRSVQSGKGM